ncbi:DUF4191 domain-containing protein [Arthrobacter glacialis]|uniref:DUF4191 domain-containing protein n=1 Tax=Arthrobacter glacialis TaxID=1664 RepID=A0A2S3ZUF7_ARTGL|nr:DUF4191 domain-containing protein [Arthrobacter glacialis]POH58297.1 DUF4191 domain-containing protein [Arthrobacter glacialis]POH72813.1 DUF4191 domain-containing protein [Arthrobacter glacialis]
MAKTTDFSQTDAEQPKRSLFSRSPKADKPKKTKKPSRIKQMVDIFKMTRRHDPMVTWLMLGAFLGPIALSLLVGFLFNNWITGLLIGIPLGLLCALLIMSRRAERAAYSQIEGKPGAAGAALSSLKRGWIFDEQPASVNPRTQDVVFRAIGRPGIVLVTEGPSARVKGLVDAERRRLSRILPNVTITVIETGKGEGQVPIAQITKKMNKLKNELTKIEVSAVNKRIASMGTKLPIPKGIDPYKARPDRKASRGR